MLSEAEIKAKLDAAKNEQQRAVTEISDIQRQISALDAKLPQMYAELNALIGKIEAYTVVLNEMKADTPKEE